MNQWELAGLLMTYSEKARRASSTERLQELARELKRELNASEIKRMKVER